ncbi:hypothetical protein N0V90_000215 [Kalmusia sp. IMI 367209]|nr:hypothetical protein N0V90_000215 [Kalmusia sp. IMI 367209]
MAVPLLVTCAILESDDKIKVLVEKLASLEDTVRQTAPHIQSVTSASASTTNPKSPEDVSPRPLKRSRAEQAAAQDLLSPPNSVISQLHRNGRARDHIEKELSYNESLASHQRSVFETAISFIDQLSQAPSNSIDDDAWCKVPTDFAKGELVQIILKCQQNDDNKMDMQLLSLDHIPQKALERMALCLLDGTADERTLNLCKVVVHFKAGLGLYASQLQTPKNAKIRKHVQGMQLHHLNAALTALDAAVLMYIIGNSTSCWSLTAHASRTLVALGYHNVHNLISKSEQDQEIHAAVAWCYHFDSIMGLLLLRPPSLPKLQVPISSLVEYNPHNPMAIFALIMLELVPIHEKLLDFTLPGQTKDMSKSEVGTQVDDLRAKMDKIYSMVEQVRMTTHLLGQLLIEVKARANNRSANSADYQLHWHSLEFKFFSTLTAVHRLSNTVCFCASERDKCLYAARRALQCVKSIQDLATQQDHFLEEYSPYLSWTILSYPLSPFFVLFCNVVGTSNASDFRLLQDVVDSVSSLVIENKHVERLRRLCNTLLSLCRPLVQQDLDNANPPSTQETWHSLAPNATPPNAARNEDMAMPPGDTVVENSEGSQEVKGTNELWNDDMMWQLFQCQPSLDWFNSDILDPGTWDLNLPS